MAKVVEGGSSTKVSFWGCDKWELVWHMSFNQCSETGVMLLPFTKSWFGKALWAGPGEMVIEERWVSQPAYIFLKLKGKV